MSENEVQIKEWWKSLTVWTNVVSVALAILLEFVPIVKGAMPLDNPVAWLTVISAAINLYLRFMVTRQPISLRAAIKPMVYDQVIVQELAPDPPVAEVKSWRFKTWISGKQ